MDVTKEDIFDYLEELSESGATNMLNAGKNLEDDFNLDTGTARTLLQSWMTHKINENN